MKVDKFIAKENKSNLDSVNHTVSFRNFTPLVKKRLNPLFFVTLLLVMNVITYKLLSKSLNEKQSSEISILKKEIAALKNSNQIDIVLLNKINTLNETNRDELLEILKTRMDRSLERFKDEKTQMSNLKKQMGFDFENYLKDKPTNRLIAYNEANYNTLSKRHGIIEQRLKERNDELKDAFISGHDLKKVENVQSFKKLQDKLTIELYAVVQKNRMRRAEFRRKKFIYSE